MACPRTRGASRCRMLGMAKAGRLMARRKKARGHSPAASRACLVGRNRTRPRRYRRSPRAGCAASTRTAIKTAESTAQPRPLQDHPGLMEDPFGNDPNDPFACARAMECQRALWVSYPIIGFGCACAIVIFLSRSVFTESAKCMPRAQTQAFEITR